MDRFNDPEIAHWIDERAWQRSVGVLACEFTRRPAAWSLERRDAVRTRSRDG